MKKPNVILASEAARRWGCTAQCVYNALEAGKLTEVRMGRHRLILKDQKYRRFKVKNAGGRLHKRYVHKKKTK